MNEGVDPGCAWQIIGVCDQLLDSGLIETDALAGYNRDGELYRQTPSRAGYNIMVFLKLR